MEPLNKGHVGISHFVFCREVVRSSEIQNVVTIWENEHLRPWSVSFIERIFLLCPLLAGSFIGGSTIVYCQLVYDFKRYSDYSVNVLVWLYLTVQLHVFQALLLQRITKGEYRFPQEVSFDTLLCQMTPQQRTPPLKGQVFWSNGVP